MNKSIVIDIGTARVKTASHSKVNGILNYRKFDTFLSKKVSAAKVIDKDYISNELIPLLSNVIVDARENGCTKAMLVGTHIFRDAVNSNEITSIIKEHVGPLNILPGWLEGAVLFTHLNEKLKGKFAVCDIGGGSVQISTGATQNEIFSIPTGTFTLERDFQVSKDVASDDELNKMSSYILGHLKGVVINTMPDYIVIGSNNMSDFFKAIHEKAKLEPSGSINSNAFYHVASLKSILTLIKGVPYNQLADYFPSNPIFMYGADKAILNIIRISESLGVQIPLVPTNESLSNSLLELLSCDEEALKELDIEYFDL